MDSFNKSKVLNKPESREPRTSRAFATTMFSKHLSMRKDIRKLKCNRKHNSVFYPKSQAHLKHTAYCRPSRAVLTERSRVTYSARYTRLRSLFSAFFFVGRKFPTIRRRFAFADLVSPDRSLKISTKQNVYVVKANTKWFKYDRD